MTKPLNKVNFKRWSSSANNW